MALNYLKVRKFGQRITAWSATCDCGWESKHGNKREADRYALYHAEDAHQRRAVISTPRVV